MKFILSCLLALSGINVYAQKWEIGLNGGMLLDAHSNKIIRNENTNKNILSPILSLKGAYNTKHWQLGAGVDYMQLDGGTVGQYMDYLLYLGTYNLTLSSYAVDQNQRMHFAAPAIPIYAFVNRKLTQTRVAPFVGASLGYLTCFRPAGPVPGVPDPAFTFHGLLFSLQAGANYKLSRHFGINAEIKATNMRFEMNGNTFHRYMAALTTGAHYTF